MKIIVSGYHNPYFVTVTEYIERALRSIGHDVVTFNDRDHIFPGRLRKKISLFQKLSVAAINQGLLKLAAQTRPDAVLVTGGHRITKRTLQRLSWMKVWVALWTMDPPKFSDIMFKTAPYYHHIFCQGTEYMDIFRQMGLSNADWLPMACDPQVHRRVEVAGEEKLKYGNDVVFVGSYYPHRPGRFSRCPRSILGFGGQAGMFCHTDLHFGPSSTPLIRRRRYGPGYTPPAKLFFRSIIAIHRSYSPCIRPTPGCSRPWPAAPSS